MFCFSFCCCFVVVVVGWFKCLIHLNGKYKPLRGKSLQSQSIDTKSAPFQPAGPDAGQHIPLTVGCVYANWSREHNQRWKYTWARTTSSTAASLFTSKPSNNGTVIGPTGWAEGGRLPSGDWHPPAAGCPQSALGGTGYDEGIPRRSHCPPGNPGVSNLSRNGVLFTVNNSKKAQPLWSRRRRIDYWLLHCKRMGDHRLLAPLRWEASCRGFVLLGRTGKDYFPDVMLSHTHCVFPHSNSIMVLSHTWASRPSHRETKPLKWSHPSYLRFVTWTLLLLTPQCSVMWLKLRIVKAWFPQATGANLLNQQVMVL